MIYLVCRHYGGRVNQKTMRLFTTEDDVIDYLNNELKESYWFRVFKFDNPGAKPIVVTEEFEKKMGI